MIGETIPVLYSCAGCGLRDAEVAVPVRTVEDVVVWVEQVLGAAIGNDHAVRSPQCLARSMSEVKVPMTGRTKIGGPVEN